MSILLERGDNNPLLGLIMDNIDMSVANRTIRLCTAVFDPIHNGGKREEIPACAPFIITPEETGISSVCGILSPHRSLRELSITHELTYVDFGDGHLIPVEEPSSEILALIGL